MTSAPSGDPPPYAATEFWEGAIESQLDGVAWPPGMPVVIAIYCRSAGTGALSREAGARLELGQICFLSANSPISLRPPGRWCTCHDSDDGLYTFWNYGAANWANQDMCMQRKLDWLARYAVNAGRAVNVSHVAPAMFIIEDPYTATAGSCGTSHGPQGKPASARLVSALSGRGAYRPHFEGETETLDIYGSFSFGERGGARGRCDWFYLIPWAPRVGCPLGLSHFFVAFLLWH